MSALGTRISTSGDFPRTAVYRRDGTLGPVCTVAFDNPEFGSGKQRVTALAGLAALVLFLPGAIYGAQAAEAIGVSWIFGVAVVPAIFAGLFLRLQYPWTIKRAIELDFGADQLRVLSGGRVVIARPLSRMANLTIEDHPDAALARLNRQERGQKSPRDVEKQHCLMGWFGVGGAEQVILVTRAEFPNRNSLFEVRQAILWAADQASATAPADAARPARSGIKPPLD